MASNILTDEFCLLQGVKQGDILSPLLFALYISDMPTIEEFKSSFPPKIIQYADDTVSIASSPSEIIKQIDTMISYGNSLGLEINYSKTKILKIQLNKRFPTDETFSYKIGIESIELVDEFKYLGIPFTSNLKWDLAIRTAINRGNTTINALKAHNINPFLISQYHHNLLINSKIYGTTLYGAQLWGCYCNDKINEPMINYFKKIFNLPSFTASLLIYKEFDLYSKLPTAQYLAINYLHKANHSDNALISNAFISIRKLKFNNNLIVKSEN